MPLAGRMRLSTFLAAAGGCAVGSLGFAAVAALVLPAFGVVLFGATASAPAPVEAPFFPADPPPTVIDVAPPAGPPESDPGAPTPPPDAGPKAREVDAIVLSYQGKDLGSDKRKDVTAGAPYKVNVYQDAGNPTANRAKIDLDRDEKWDEKITFEPGRITRQVAPADDDVYTQTFHWVDGVWKPE